MRLDVDDQGQILLGGVLLPGIGQTIEVIGEAQIDETEIQGTKQKGTTPLGWAPDRVILGLVVRSDEHGGWPEKVRQIEALFRPSGSSTPPVYNLVAEHTAARGVTQVLFANLRTREDVKRKDLVSCTLEFVAYRPVPVVVKRRQTSPDDDEDEGFDLWADVVRDTRPRPGLLTELQLLPE